MFYRSRQKCWSSFLTVITCARYYGDMEIRKPKRMNAKPYHGKIQSNPEKQQVRVYDFKIKTSNCFFSDVTVKSAN